MERMIIVACLLLTGLGNLVIASPARSESNPTTSAPDSSENPVLINTCLISNNVQQLAAFYQKVLKIAPRFDGGDYVEFKTGAGVLTIFDAHAQERYIPGSAEPSANRSAILEFRVANVNTEYARLQSIVKTWVKPPTTQPWGTRSIYFRDPDGNLVNFFTSAKAK